MSDALTQILNTARLKSSVYCRSELGSPWGLQFAPRSCAVFHVLYRGNGCFCMEDDETMLSVAQGDVLLLPGGEAHLLLETPAAPVFGNLELDQWGECVLMRWSETPAAVVLCGTFDFEFAETAAFLKRLPRLIHIPYHPESTLNQTLDLMACESESARPAKEVILRRLADILFVQIMQRWVELQGAANSGWLGALHDPFIGRALDLIHTQPEHAWTVAELARAAASSRSSFVARFTALTGEAPMEYLTRWRMQLAARLIEQADVRVSEVAAQVGYRSEAAFSRAFKRTFGIAPRKWHSKWGVQSPDRPIK